MQERKARSLERWFRLLTALQGGAHPTADELAARFGVTRRTVFRDLNALEENGVPIVRDGGRYGVLDSYRMRPVQFTTEEVLALVAALDFAGRRRSLGGTAAAAALDKLRAVMPGPQQELAAGLDEALVVDPWQAHDLPGAPGVEQALRAATQGQHPVRIRYHALSTGAVAERKVRAYGLAYRGTGLYLIGFCELRQDKRTFRVNRILSAEVLPERFERPADFDLEQYLMGVWGIEDGPRMEVRVRFGPEVARLATETRWHPTQHVAAEPDGSVVLSLATHGKNELARWLAGFGGTVAVLAPPELGEAVLRLGQGIVARYGGAG